MSTSLFQDERRDLSNQYADLEVEYLGVFLEVKISFEGFELDLATHN